MRIEKNWKSFGDVKTHLRRTDLSEKALNEYSATDPLNIYEEVLEDGSYIYHLRGCVDADDLTSEELNSLLESMADEDLEEE